ncbi:MAG TPA: S24 family peptidase [Burkholderiales bacterium]|nr:S24 family peptidase [Burkholderiales bacterium]
MSIDVSYLAKLQDYYARHNVIPSYATLGKLWGISAKSWVANYVNRFKEEGYLKLAPDRRLGPGPRFFERRLARVPVRAGLPEAEQEGGYEVVTIDGYLVKQPSKTSLIRVKGDSMVDAGILEGDLVVVEQQHAANVGDIVVAIVDEEFTIKYLDRERGSFVLRPANKAYPVIRPKGNLEIFGVMVGLVRRVGRR